MRRCGIGGRDERRRAGSGEKFAGIFWREIGDDGFDLRAGIYGAEAALGGYGFREIFRGVGFFEQSLALEVGRLDEIAIDDAQRAQAGADELIGDGCTGGAAADQDGAGIEEALLAGFADSGEEDLA